MSRRKGHRHTDRRTDTPTHPLENSPHVSGVNVVGADVDKFDALLLNETQRNVQILHLLGDDLGVLVVATHTLARDNFHQIDENDAVLEIFFHLVDFQTTSCGKAKRDI